MQIYMSVEDKTIARPFLRWAGGKRWFLKHIYSFLPENINNYHEPFLGGGSVYWNLKQAQRIQNIAYLSDINSELINAYVQLRDNYNQVIDLLKTYVNTEQFYYKLRALIPNDDIFKAARFIYLNATSYNGIYRVNRNGIYNVPYGHRNKYNLFDFKNFDKCAELLDATVVLNVCDFDVIRENLRENDLVFLDPPYTVAHENNGFIQYNQHLFSWEDQVRLAELLQFVNEQGAYFILTNAAHESIDVLFNGIGERYVLNRHSTIGGRGANRTAVNEYIFTNTRING